MRGEAQLEIAKLLIGSDYRAAKLCIYKCKRQLNSKPNPGQQQAL